MFWDSKDETTNKASSAGNNINNVTITHPVEIAHDWYGILLAIITGIKVIELVYIIYRSHQRKTKKRYQQQQQMQLPRI